MTPKRAEMTPKRAEMTPTHHGRNTYPPWKEHLPTMVERHIPTMVERHIPTMVQDEGIPTMVLDGGDTYHGMYPGIPHLVYTVLYHPGYTPPSTRHGHHRPLPGSVAVRGPWAQA